MFFKMFVVAVFLAFFPPALCLSKLTLYSSAEDSPPLVIDGKDCPFGMVLDSSFNFTCACLTGLWAFYDNACNSPLTILGAWEEKCVFLNQTIEKVHLLSAPETSKQTALIFIDDKKQLVGRLELDSTEGIDIPSSTGPTQFLLSSGVNNWEVNPGNKCFGKQSKVAEYCDYHLGTEDDSVLTTDCAGQHSEPSEERCTNYILTHSNECVKYVKPPLPPPPLGPNIIAGQQGSKPSKENKPPLKVDEKVEPAVVLPVLPTKLPELEKSNEKAVIKGRTFIKRPTGNATIATANISRPTGNATIATANISRPDYHKNSTLTVNIMTPSEINSHVWNYLTSRAHEILNLSHPKDTPLTPTFKLLDLSKQIMQKACPDHYVKDEHFDLALHTFINLHKKNFGFQDGFSDFDAKQRIEDSLYLCLQNISVYPFLDPMKRSAGRACNEPVELGTFERFGKKMNLNVSSESSGRGREPLVETVWKIFTHAHAACYRYFEEVGFNDHHRFTSVMMPVFTNGIHDIWKSMSDLSQETYAGLLGDPIKLMDGVTYCAEFSKLDSEYPWELSRPEKELGRRKRSLSSKGRGICLREGFDNECARLPPPKPDTDNTQLSQPLESAEPDTHQATDWV